MPVARHPMFWLCALKILMPMHAPAQQPDTRAQPSAAAAPDGQEPVPLGTNLAPVNDWNREWVFVDVFKQARAWFSQLPSGTDPWDDGREVATTPEGWPLLAANQAAATLICRELEGHYPGGRYLCTYEGTGRLSFGFDARAVDARPGRIEVAVRPSNEGILLRVVASSPEDPIRNIRLLMPTEHRAGDSPFTQLYLQRLRPFGVLRFMDWARTNEQEDPQWSQRTTTESARQSTTAGVAIEYMIALCNELEADPWFCMPHRAGDDYVRAYAELVRDRLHADATVYVEWSNEAWNHNFPQGRWTQAQADARGILPPEVTADEAARDWQIWRDVFGEDRARIVRVAAGQHYNPWVAETMAARLDGQLDAISCAAYFGDSPEGPAEYPPGATVADVIDRCRENIKQRAIPLFQQHAALARHWSRQLGREIPLLAYEGGQHLSTYGAEPPHLELYYQAQADPQMGQLYAQLFDGWRRAGGGRFVAYNFVSPQSKWGCWGHLEYQTQPIDEAPKFAALLRAGGVSGGDAPTDDN